MLTRFVGFNWLAVCVAAVVSESKKAVSAVAAAVVGIGLLSAPLAVGQERPPDESLPSDSPSLLSPYVNSVEVHNHSSSGFSISVDFGSGWEAFGGAQLCEWHSFSFGGGSWFCFVSDTSSGTYRWPAPVYLANPPRGTSTHSYDFKIRPKLREGLAEGRPYTSEGLDIDLTVYIEVTDGAVSSIYCWLSYPSTYLGPFRRSSYYPYLIYQGTTYVNGFWYSDSSR